MTCLVCGEPLTGRRTVVCSKACRTRRLIASDAFKQADAKRYITKRCESCLSEYRSKHPTSRFCSRVCNNIAQTAPTCSVPDRRPSRRVPLVHTERGFWSAVPWRVCGWCDELFIANQVQVGLSEKRTHSYCSKACKQKRQRSNRRAREYGAAGSYTWGHVMRTFVQQGKRCAYCELPIDGQPDPEHVVPLSRGGSNRPGNVVAACRECNSEKQAMLLHEWAAWRTQRGKPPLPGLTHLAAA